MFFPPACASLVSVPDLVSLPSSPSSSPACGQPSVVTPGTLGLRFAVVEPVRFLNLREQVHPQWGGVEVLKGTWTTATGVPAPALIPPRMLFLLCKTLLRVLGYPATGGIWGCKGHRCISGTSYSRQWVFTEECCSAPLTSGDISVACTKPRVSFLLLSTTNVNLGGSGRRARSGKMWETNYKFLWKSKCVFLNTPPLKMRLRFSFHNKPEL